MPSVPPGSHGLWYENAWAHGSDGISRAWSHTPSPSFPPPQTKSRHGTFLGGWWDVHLLTQAQLLPPLVVPRAVSNSAWLAGHGLWSKRFILGSTWCYHCQFSCSHGEPLSAVWSLLTRETGPVTSGRDFAPGVTHPSRQCLEMWAVRLHTSRISAALPRAARQRLHFQPLFFQHAAGISVCSNLWFPYSSQHLLCRDSCVQVFAYWVLGSLMSFGKS